MNKISSLITCKPTTTTLGLFVFAALLAVFLLASHTEAFRSDASSVCPYLSQASSAGCPYLADAVRSGCPHGAAVKGSGCPYVARAKGCLHALHHSLRLDKEQMERVREIQAGFLDESSEMKRKVLEATTELDRLFRNPEASPDDVAAKRKHIAGLREQLEEMAMDSRIRIRGELTDEQIRQIPEGCWHGVLAYGHGKAWGCGHPGCVCPHKAGHADRPA